jgi:hypothetical protein
LFIIIYVSLFKKEFLELMDAGQSFGAERSFDSSDSEAFAGECLVGHGDTVIKAFISYCMDS